MFSTSFFSLPLDTITEIALRIDDLTSYVAWLNTCHTARKIDARIKGIKQSQLIVKLTKDVVIKRGSRDTQVNNANVTAKYIYDKEKGRALVIDGVCDFSLINISHDRGNTLIMRERGFYSNGVRVGIWTVENRSYITLFPYVNGKKNGVAMRFFIKDNNNIINHIYTGLGAQLFNDAGLEHLLCRVSRLSMDMTFIDDIKVSGNVYRRMNVITRRVYENGEYKGSYLYKDGFTGFVHSWIKQTSTTDPWITPSHEFDEKCWIVEK